MTTIAALIEAASCIEASFWTHEWVVSDDPRLPLLSGSIVLEWLGQLLTVTLHDPDQDFRSELDGLEVGWFGEREAWLFEAGRALLVEGRNPKDDDWETHVVERLTHWSTHLSESPISWLPFPFGGSDWSIEDDLWLNLRLMWIGPGGCLRTVEQVREARRWVDLIATNEVFTAAELPDDLLVGVGELLIETEAWDPSPPAGTQGKAAAPSATGDSVLPPLAATTAPAQPATSSLEILTFRELSDAVGARPAPSYLIRGILACADYGVLAAEPKAGKTWAMTDAVVSVASGSPFLGSFEVDTTGPVLVFAGEGGDRKIKRRIEAVCRSRGVDPDSIADRVHVCLRAPHLADQEAMRLVAVAIARIRPVLVIIDPLYLAARGANTADLAEMGAHLEAIQSVCQLAGAALLIAHHWNKTGLGRGSSRMSGAGPAAWGRVLISAAVVRRQTDATTGRTDVELELEFTGDEIAESTVRIRRSVWAEDPADLGSPLHYGVTRLADLEPADSDPDGLSPSSRRVLSAL